ncbi:MAG: hypothetical protein JST59_02585 [Actinobacteria bacterium]|nr:hypothetical protein [Actinomycetota bacterium]
MGAFLGFHIRQTQKCGDTYIKFLQNNPLDSEAFIDRKKKVMDFYDKV